ncbi:hypothetical protein XACLG97_10780006 [Xanthomonas citri pv. citri]|nr:hypothetical protein XACLG97_10780006 [Xanthomonas citri pv. citri]
MHPMFLSIFRLGAEAVQLDFLAE